MTESGSSAPIDSMRELAALVEAELARALGSYSEWSLEPTEVGNRSLRLCVRRREDSIQLLVESAANQGEAAAVGKSLQVIAPVPPADSRLFDELARAVTALEVSLQLAAEPPAVAEAPGIESQDVPLGGYLYNPSRRERSFHLVNLGLPRTGTTSIAAMFSGWRSAHEFWITPFSQAAYEQRAGRQSGAGVMQVLRAREAAGRLEVDSASFLHLAVEQVVELYPSSAYVLTWRPFESWLDSFLDLLLRQARAPKAARWLPRVQQLASIMLGKFDARSFDSAQALLPVVPQLATNALHFWVQSMTRTLDALPQRALVLPVSQLSQAGPALARLVGVPSDSVLAKRENIGEADRESWSARLPAELAARAQEQTMPLVARLRGASGQARGGDQPK